MEINTDSPNNYCTVRYYHGERRLSDLVVVVNVVIFYRLVAVSATLPDQLFRVIFGHTNKMATVIQSSLPYRSLSPSPLCPLSAAHKNGSHEHRQLSRFSSVGPGTRYNSHFLFLFQMLQYVSSKPALTAAEDSGLIVSRVLLAETQVANSGRWVVGSVCSRISNFDFLLPTQVRLRAWQRPRRPRDRARH